jgi:hypothetical protein
MTNVVRLRGDTVICDDPPNEFIDLLERAAALYVRHWMRKHPGVHGFEMDAILDQWRREFHDAARKLP